MYMFLCVFTCICKYELSMQFADRKVIKVIKVTRKENPVSNRYNAFCDYWVPDKLLDDCSCRKGNSS